MDYRGVIILIVGVFLINFVSASFDIGTPTHSIETNYNPSDSLSGWINISLYDEPANSTLEDSNGKKITILKLLQGNQNLNYFCSPKTCLNSYTLQDSGEDTLSFSLDSREEKLIGIKISGNINSINSLNLTVKSDAGASCYPQIGLDILNDELLDITTQNKSLGENSCESLLDKGCFEEGTSFEQQYVVQASPKKYCQRITFQPSLSFMLGAWISNPDNGYGKITMAVYNLSMAKVGSAQCNISSSISKDGGYYSCQINHTVKEEKEYFVCIYSNRTENFKIKGYGDESSGCGFYNESDRIGVENAAFDIFAQGLGFGAVGEIKISNYSIAMSKIKDYIYSQYGSYNCQQNDCIIPIRIISQTSQKVDLKDLELKYTTNLGVTTTDKMYFIQKTPPIINSSFQKVYINSANFPVSDDKGKEIVKVYFNEERIFSQNITIRDLPKITSLSPLVAPSMIPVNFIVYTDSNKNITEYSWDFNDSTPIQKTTSNKNKHTYNKSGSYQITIRVKDSDGFNTSKTFGVVASIPFSQIGLELKRKLTLLEKVKEDLSKLDSATKEELMSALNIESLERKIKEIQRDYENINSRGENYKEEDYLYIVGNLTVTDIPENVAITKNYLSLPFYPALEKINLDIIKFASGGGYISEKAAEYKTNLIGWQIENSNININAKEYSAIIENVQHFVLMKFEIDIEKNFSEKPVYFFIKKIGNLSFKENYRKNEEGDYYYWKLEEDNEKIEFSTSEQISHENLPIFISPELSLIEPLEPPQPFIEKIIARIWLILIALIILFIVALLVYTLLSIWYNRKYESYLFRNRNDLYNLISYVNISKKSREKEEVMRINLKKAGWTGEQITYILKKYSGKRTGMIELPITKFIDKIIQYSERSKAATPKTRPEVRIKR